MSNERSEIILYSDEECPLCGEYLTIVKYDNKKAKLCGLSEYCGYILLLGTASE